MKTRCAKCDAAMSCSPEGNCWCMELPHGPMPVASTEEVEGCLCRACLEQKLHGLGVGGKLPLEL